MGCWSIGDRVHKEYESSHGLRDSQGNYTRAGILNLVSRVMLLALFGVGVVATGTAMGVFPPMTPMATGLTVAGLGAGYLFMQLGGCQFKERYVDLICETVFALAMMTMGGLGAAGVISVPTVGYSLIGILSVHTVFWGCCCHTLAAPYAKFDND